MSRWVGNSAVGIGSSAGFYADIGIILGKRRGPQRGRGSREREIRRTGRFGGTRRGHGSKCVCMRNMRRQHRPSGLLLCCSSRGCVCHRQAKVQTLNTFASRAVLCWPPSVRRGFAQDNPIVGVWVCLQKRSSTLGPRIRLSAHLSSKGTPRNPLRTFAPRLRIVLAVARASNASSMCLDSTQLCIHDVENRSILRVLLPFAQAKYGAHAQRALYGANGNSGPRTDQGYARAPYP
jgi:hypothetical protein